MFNFRFVRALERLFSKTIFPIGVYAEVAVLEYFTCHPNGYQFVWDICDQTRVNPGSLYGILRRLERRGWFTSGWEVVTGRRGYYLTDLGYRRAWQTYPNMLTTFEPDLGGAR